MTKVTTIPFVGAPDPELKNSVIIEETDEEADTLGLGGADYPLCYFNGVAYEEGRALCSGKAERLRCRGGAWVREGSCDPDHP